ncbi:MAG: DUF2325 domain-containing protein [Tepidibacillus sp.]
MKRLAVIGGNQKNTLQKMANKKGLELIHHDGKVLGKGFTKTFETIVRKADAVVIMKGACNHNTMWLVKDLAKKYDKPIGYSEGIGASAALEAGNQLLT